MESNATLASLTDDELTVVASMLVRASGPSGVCALRSVNKRLRRVVDGCLLDLAFDLRAVSSGACDPSAPSAFVQLSRRLQQHHAPLPAGADLKFPRPPPEEAPLRQRSYSPEDAMTRAAQLLRDTRAMPGRCEMADGLRVRLFCHPAAVAALEALVMRQQSAANANDGPLSDEPTPSGRCQADRAHKDACTCSRADAAVAQPPAQPADRHGRDARAAPSPGDAPAAPALSSLTARLQGALRASALVDTSLKDRLGGALATLGQGRRTIDEGCKALQQRLRALGFASAAAESVPAEGACTATAPAARGCSISTAVVAATAPPDAVESTTQIDSARAELRDSQAGGCERAEPLAGCATPPADDSASCLLPPRAIASTAAPPAGCDEAASASAACERAQFPSERGRLASRDGGRRARALKRLEIEAEVAPWGCEGSATSRNGFAGYIYVPTCLAGAWPVLKTKTRATLSSVPLPVNQMVPGMWTNDVEWDVAALADAISMHRHLAGALASASGLTHLTIRRTLYGRIGALMVAEALPALEHLQHLALRDTFFGDTGLQSVAAALSGHTALRSLDLHGNNLNNARHGGVADVLARNPALESLVLSCNHMGQQSAAELRVALAQHTALRHLDLSYNRFSLSSAPSLVAVVLRQPALEYLDVSSNHHQGAQASAEALRLWLMALTERRFAQLKVVRLHQVRDLGMVSAMQDELLERVRRFQAQFGGREGALECGPVLDSVVGASADMQELLAALTAAVRSMQPQLQLTMLPHVAAAAPTTGSPWPVQPVLQRGIATEVGNALATAAHALTGSFAWAAAGVVGGLETARDMLARGP